MNYSEMTEEQVFADKAAGDRMMGLFLGIFALPAIIWEKFFSRKQK